MGSEQSTMKGTQDLNMSLLNFTGSNEDILEFVTSSVEGLPQGTETLTKIFNMKCSLGDYLKTYLSDNQISELYGHDILLLILDVFDNGFPTKVEDAFIAELRKYRNFFDLPMPIIGQLLVMEKAVSGFDKIAKDRLNNPLKQKVSFNEMFKYFFGDDNHWDSFKIDQNRDKNFKVGFLRNYIKIASQQTVVPEISDGNVKEIGRVMLFVFDMIITDVINQLGLGDKFDLLKNVNYDRHCVIANYVSEHNIDIMFLTEYKPNEQMGNDVSHFAELLPDYDVFMGPLAKGLCNAVLVNQKTTAVKLFTDNLILEQVEGDFLDPSGNHPEVPCIVAMTANTDTIHLVSVHTNGKAKLAENQEIVDIMNDNYKYYIYGVDANMNLTGQIENTSIVFPGPESGNTVGKSRTVFQTQLDKSAVKTYPGEPIADTDVSQKDYILSNIEALSGKKGVIHTLTPDGKGVPANLTEEGQLLPIWQNTKILQADGMFGAMKKVTLYHPFDHAMITVYGNISQVNEV